MRKFLVLATLLIVAAMPGRAADDAALKQLVTGNDSRGWEGVGRIDFAGRSFCTGALIADNLVLTAAHCLFDADTGRAFQPAEITFLAGWRNGRASAYRGVRRAVAHPDYLTAADRNARISHDLALIELDQSIRNTSVQPFGTDKRPRNGASVGVVSYAHNRSESPSLQEVCHVLARQSGILVLSCDIDFGSSGAPVFVIENGVAHIVSVISAKSETDGKKVALGTDLLAPLAKLHEIMASGDGVFVRQEPQVRRLTVEPNRGSTGAKFVRP